MKLILNERQFQKYIKHLVKEENTVQQMPVPKKVNKPYCINPDNVLTLKRFLDNGFQRAHWDRIGDDGMPQRENIVTMLSVDKQPLKNMYLTQLRDLLSDKFQKMVTDDTVRDTFMMQVVNDWFNNKIGTFGTLSVNHL